jgi:hypothetical protein
MHHWRFRQLAFHTLPRETLCALPAPEATGPGESAEEAKPRIEQEEAAARVEEAEKAGEAGEAEASCEGAALLHAEGRAQLLAAHAWYIQRRCSTHAGGVDATCDTPQRLCEAGRVEAPLPSHA